MSFSSKIKKEIANQEKNLGTTPTKEYLKTCFIECGSISDPNKNYHLEFVSPNEKNSNEISNVLNFCGLTSKTVQRKGYFVVYIKEGEQIADFINIIGAHNSLMEFENIRILKDIGNNVNRLVNCETANLSKTIAAALKQQEDIEFIIKKKGLSFLSPELKVVAQARLEFMDISLKELGEKINPMITKSCINHRLRKISQIAENLRKTH